MRLAKNSWYAVLESRELAAKPVGLRRVSVDMVFWRDGTGTPVAQADRCPHMGASLSHGTVENGCLTCPFHGMRFNAEGRCILVPSMGTAANIPDALQARTFPTREKHGFIWLWWGDAPPADAIPFFDELDSGWNYRTTPVEWHTNYTRAIENQLDVAHLAFIHRTTIGRGGRSRVDGPWVEGDDSGIKVWVTNRRDDVSPARTTAQLQALASKRQPSLYLKYPGIWRLNISASMINLIAFVPIDEDRVLYYLRAYLRRGSPVRWLMLLLSPALNRTVLNQDRRVVLTQTPLNSLDVRDDHLVPADRAIMEYRKWLAKAIDSD